MILICFDPKMIIEQNLNNNSKIEMWLSQVC